MPAKNYYRCPLCQKCTQRPSEHLSKRFKCGQNIDDVQRNALIKQMKDDFSNHFKDHPTLSVSDVEQLISDADSIPSIVDKVATSLGCPLILDKDVVQMEIPPQLADDQGVVMAPGPAELTMDELAHAQQQQQNQLDEEPNLGIDEPNAVVNSINTDNMFEFIAAPENKDIQPGPTQMHHVMDAEPGGSLIDTMEQEKWEQQSCSKHEWQSDEHISLVHPGQPQKELTVSGHRDLDNEFNVVMDLTIHKDSLDQVTTLPVVIKDPLSTTSYNMDIQYKGHLSIPVSCTSTPHNMGSQKHVITHPIDIFHGTSTADKTGTPNNSDEARILQNDLIPCTIIDHSECSQKEVDAESEQIDDITSLAHTNTAINDIDMKSEGSNWSMHSEDESSESSFAEKMKEDCSDEFTPSGRKKPTDININSDSEHILLRRGEKGMKACWKNPLHQRIGQSGLYNRISSEDTTLESYRNFLTYTLHKKGPHVENMVSFVARLHYHLQDTEETAPSSIDIHALTRIAKVESFFREASQAGIKASTKIAQYKVLAHWIQFVKKELPPDDQATYIGVQRLEDQLKSWKKGANKQMGEDHGQHMFDHDPLETYEPLQEFLSDSQDRALVMHYIKNKDDDNTTDGSACSWTARYSYVTRYISCLIQLKYFQRPSVAENLKLCQFLSSEHDKSTGRYATRVRDHKTASKQAAFITWDNNDYELIMDYVKLMRADWNASEKEETAKKIRRMLGAKVPFTKLQHAVSEELKQSEPLLTNTKGKTIANHSKERHEYVKTHPSLTRLSATAVRKCTETIVAQDQEAQKDQNVINNLLAHTPGVSRSHYTRIACSEMARAMDVVGDAMGRFGNTRRSMNECSSGTPVDDVPIATQFQGATPVLSGTEEAILDSGRNASTESEGSMNVDISSDSMPQVASKLCEDEDSMMKVVYTTFPLRGDIPSAKSLHHLFPNQTLVTTEIKKMQSKFKYRQECDIEIPDWIDLRSKRVDALEIEEVVKVNKQRGWKTRPNTLLKLFKERAPLKARNKKPANQYLQMADSVKHQTWPLIDQHNFGHPKGRGVIAITHIAKGTPVCNYQGKLLSGKEAKSFDMEDTSYVYQFSHNSKPLAIDASDEDGSLGRLINHSIHPNLNTKHIVLDGQDHLLFIANEDINIGEELCFNYGDRKSKEPFLKTCIKKDCNICQKTKPVSKQHNAAAAEDTEPNHQTPEKSTHKDSSMVIHTDTPANSTSTTKEGNKGTETDIVSHECDKLPSLEEVQPSLKKKQMQTKATPLDETTIGKDHSSKCLSSIKTTPKTIYCKQEQDQAQAQKKKCHKQNSKSEHKTKSFTNLVSASHPDNTYGSSGVGGDGGFCSLPTLSEKVMSPAKVAKRLLGNAHESAGAGSEGGFCSLPKTSEKVMSPVKVAKKLLGSTHVSAGAGGEDGFCLLPTSSEKAMSPAKVAKKILGTAHESAGADSEGGFYPLPTPSAKGMSPAKVAKKLLGSAHGSTGPGGEDGFCSLPSSSEKVMSPAKGANKLLGNTH